MKAPVGAEERSGTVTRPCESAFPAGPRPNRMSIRAQERSCALLSLLRKPAPGEPPEESEYGPGHNRNRGDAPQLLIQRDSNELVLGVPPTPYNDQFTRW